MGSLGQGSGLIGKKRNSVDGEILTIEKPSLLASYTKPTQAIGSEEITVTPSAVVETGVWSTPTAPLNNSIDENFNTAANYGIYTSGDVGEQRTWEYTIQSSPLTKIHWKFQTGGNADNPQVTLQVWNGVWTDVSPVVFTSSNTVYDRTENFAQINNCTKIRISIIAQSPGTNNAAAALRPYEVSVLSNSADASKDNNNATSSKFTGLNVWIRSEMSALVDKKPTAFHCRLAALTTSKVLALELSTDAVIWDRFGEFAIGSDLVIGQDSFVEVNLPTKDYRYYRWVALDLVSVVLDLAEQGFFVPTTTQIQYEHGHKKLF